MKHADEIKYWAEHPDNTKVWYRNIDKTEWELIKPRWDNTGIYIVDNQWSTLRKAQADGKQLQLNLGGTWMNRELTLQEIKLRNTAPKHWRVKPKEYQWFYKKYGKRGVRLTDSFYTNENEVREELERVNEMRKELELVLHNFEILGPYIKDKK